MNLYKLTIDHKIGLIEQKSITFLTNSVKILTKLTYWLFARLSRKPAGLSKRLTY